MKSKGFSLVELMIVLGVISALIAVSLIGASYATQYSHDDANVKYLVRTQQLMDKFSGYYNSYPTSSLSDCTNNSNIYDKKSMSSALGDVAGVDFLSLDALNIKNQIEIHNNVTPSDSNFAYCSSPSNGRSITVQRSANGNIIKTTMDLSDAYIGIVNMRISRVSGCTDKSSNNIYLVGSGSYTDGTGEIKTYKDLALTLFPSISDISKCFL